MTFPVSGVTPSFTAMPLTAATRPAGLEGADSAGGFAASVTAALEHVQGLQSTADSLAVQAATGTLTDVHDYTIAATEASLATEMTVALRNKAIEAFTEIMRMPV